MSSKIKKSWSNNIHGILQQFGNAGIKENLFVLIFPQGCLVGSMPFTHSLESILEVHGRFMSSLTWRSLNLSPLKMRTFPCLRKIQSSTVCISHGSPWVFVSLAMAMRSQYLLLWPGPLMFSTRPRPFLLSVFVLASISSQASCPFQFDDCFP